jgi:hypothetical protein
MPDEFDRVPVLLIEKWEYSQNKLIHSTHTLRSHLPTKTLYTSDLLQKESQGIDEFDDHL